MASPHAWVWIDEHEISHPIESHAAGLVRTTPCGIIPYKYAGRLERRDVPTCLRCAVGRTT